MHFGVKVGNETFSHNLGMLNAMSPVPKPNFEFSPYNLHKTKWPPYAFSMVINGKRYNS